MSSTCYGAEIVQRLGRWRFRSGSRHWWELRWVVPWRIIWFCSFCLRIAYWEDEGLRLRRECHQVRTFCLMLSPLESCFVMHLITCNIFLRSRSESYLKMQPLTTINQWDIWKFPCSTPLNFSYFKLYHHRLLYKTL